MKYKAERIIFIIITLLSVCFIAGCTPKYTDLTLKEKIQKGYTINILINGDSLAEGNSETSWSNQISELLKEKYDLPVNMTNISLGGNSSYAGYTRINSFDDNNTLYDLVIICYGQNDIDDGNFPIMYESLIRTTHKKYPNATIIAILESAQKEYTSKINSIMDICNKYGISYVDMISAFDQSEYSYNDLTTDGIHLSLKGEELYAENIVSVLENEVIKENKKFKNLSRPVNKGCLNYEYCCYIPASSLQIVNSQLVLETNEEFNGIGLDRFNSQGVHYTELCIDGNSIDAEYSWEYNFPQRHIDQMASGDFKSSKIVIKGEVDTISGINGIILTSNKEFNNSGNKENLQSINTYKNSLKITDTYQNSILNKDAALQNAGNDGDFIRNYTVYAYEVEPGTYVSLNSNTIGGVNTITRYAFYRDITAKELIHAGALNHGAWTDRYEAKVKVPLAAKYLLITSQNGSVPTAYINEEEEIYEELNHIEVLNNKAMDMNGKIIGGDTNNSVANYSIYIFNISEYGSLEIYTEAKANADTLMRYAYVDNLSDFNIIKKGPLNSMGWEDAVSTRSRLSGNEKYLLVTCQNSSIPVVVGLN